jgi:hypothetical protein
MRDISNSRRQDDRGSLQFGRLVVRELFCHVDETGNDIAMSRDPQNLQNMAETEDR